MNDLQLSLEFMHDLNVCWAATIEADSDTTEVLFNDPDFGPRSANMIVTSVIGIGGDAHSTGVLQPTVLCSATDLVRVVAHVFNGPDILGNRAVTICERGSRRTSRSRIPCIGGDWTITMDARFDLALATTAAKAARSACMTHVLEVCRSDGKTFSSDQAQSVLDAVSLGLSFASGRSVPVVLGVGWDALGQRGWESWQIGVCDPLSRPTGFLHKLRPEDLVELLAWCLVSHTDVAIWEPIRHSIFYYIDSMTDSLSAEGSLLLSSAGIDLLWRTRPPVADTTKPRRTPAHRRLRELLQASAVPTAVPQHLTALKSIATHLPLKDECAADPDGPCLVAGLRHEFAHPRLNQPIYNIRFATIQGGYLLRHYFELLILNRIGYQGEYLPRLMADRDTTNSIPVPWSSNAPRF